MFLEVIAFSAGIAVLALVKAAKEGGNAPWGLVIIVFVGPPAAMLYKLVPFWWQRYPVESIWGWVGFGIAFLLATHAVFQRMKPYVIGKLQLSEPLTSGLRTILAVIWLLLLLAGAGFLAHAPG